MHSIELRSSSGAACAVEDSEREWGSGPKPPLLLLPGYGAGAGFFFRNLRGLARGGLDVAAIDWLGRPRSRKRESLACSLPPPPGGTPCMHAYASPPTPPPPGDRIPCSTSLLDSTPGTGLSSRPPLPLRSRQHAESFFVDSLEAWRAARGLDRGLVLAGHSLGGYLATCYALKYPQHVRHLVLCGPAGVPPAPPAPVGRRPTLRASFSRMAWDSGLTPHMVVRCLGPLGPKLVSGYCAHRFGPGSAHCNGRPLSDSELSAFEKYLYCTLSARPSGEAALRHLLAPGAWARLPLMDRAVPGVAGGGLGLTTPTTFVYGALDWMDPSAGRQLSEALNAGGV